LLDAGLHDGPGRVVHDVEHVTRLMRQRIEQCRRKATACFSHRVGLDEGALLEAATGARRSDNGPEKAALPYR